MKKLLVTLLSALLALTLAVPGALAATEINLGSAGTSGTYYVVAAAMGQAINNHSDLIEVVVQPTKGSIENINLCDAGDIQMGMSNSDGVYWANTGTGSYAEYGEQNIYGMMSLYMSAGQMSTLASSGIETYGDLKGKKVCLGPPSTTIVEMSKSILRAYGIDPERDITPYYLAFDEGMTKLTDGEIDATFFVGGIPTAALVNAATTGSVRMVDVDPEIIAQVAEENPFYIPYSIPAGTYKGTDKDINSMLIYTEIFVNKDVSEEAVYEFVRCALEYADDYRESHTVCQEINAETASKTSAPLHPGAEKYYREIGVIE